MCLLLNRRDLRLGKRAPLGRRRQSTFNPAQVIFYWWNQHCDPYDGRSLRGQRLL